MSESTQAQTATKVFLIISLLLVPILYYTGLTKVAIGPVIYIYFIFAFISYQFLNGKHIFEMIKAFGLAPLTFCILLTPIYFANHLLQGTLLENAYTIGDVLVAWFNVMLETIAIGYLHVLVILMLFVVFYLFGGVKRLD